MTSPDFLGVGMFLFSLENGIPFASNAQQIGASS
jgi:hypothetical protein